MIIEFTHEQLQQVRLFAIMMLATVSGLSATKREWGKVTIGCAIALVIIVGKPI